MNFRSALFVLPLSFLVSCQSTPPEKRHYLSSYRGMEEQTGVLGHKSLVKVSSPSSLKRYKKVIIEDVKVIPPKKSKDEKPNAFQMKVTREETERLAEKFEDILEKELSPHYTITRRRGYDTLRVRAALTELQPSNPALFAVNYLPYAGIAATGIQLASGEALGAASTTFEAEVLDSRSGRQVYAMMDQLKGGKLQPSGLDKWGQNTQAMRIWSRKIRQGISSAEPQTAKTNTVAKKPAAKKPAPKKPAPKKTTTAKKKPASSGSGDNSDWLKKLLSPEKKEG